MKYANSLKYMNGFASANSGADISHKRIRELCMALGRINLGMSYIVLPKSAAGHACALMLESVIKSAGYNVGRISSWTDFDSRACVMINRDAATIDNYNKCVTEIKNVLKKYPDETFFKEEISFVLSLLLCKLNDCKYVILEGLAEDGMNLDVLCSPYDLIVIPTAYEAGESDKVKLPCEAVRRGTREVISGNQRSDIYNRISNACAMSGVRLYIPVKAQFEVKEVSPRKLCFEYGGRGGYILRSPSYMLRDCAMTVIEASLAIRRGGVKLPWSAIEAGIAAVTESGCFDMISASPKIIADIAESREELELALKTADELWGKEENISLCVYTDSISDDFFEAFADRKINHLILVGQSDDGLEPEMAESIINCNSYEEAVKIIKSENIGDEPLLCFGGITFCSELKKEYIKQMGL